MPDERSIIEFLIRDRTGEEHTVFATRMEQSDYTRAVQFFIGDACIAIAFDPAFVRTVK